MIIFRRLVTATSMLAVSACGNQRTLVSSLAGEKIPAPRATPTAEDANHTRQVIIEHSNVRNWQEAIRNTSDVAFSKVDQIVDLSPLTEMQRLEVIDIAFNDYSEQQLLPLTRVKSLRVALIEGNSLTQSFIDALGRLPSMHLIYHGGSFSCPMRPGLSCAGAGGKP